MGPDNIKLFDPQFEFITICGMSKASGILDYLELRKRLVSSYGPSNPMADLMCDMLVLLHKDGYNN